MRKFLAFERWRKQRKRYTDLAPGRFKKSTANRNKKAALAALVFEDWNGASSSQRTAPKVIKAN
jgi:hypothetical protein